MERILDEDDLLMTRRMATKRRGPGRRRNFVQENIAVLRELQTKLREKGDAATVVRTRRKTLNQKSSRTPKTGASQGARKQRTPTGKHSARKGKKSPKFQPRTSGDNKDQLDVKLTAKEKLLLRGHGPHKSQSSSDLLSDLSSTENEPDVVDATTQRATGVSEASKNLEVNVSHNSAEVQEAGRSTSPPSKKVATIRHASTAGPAGEGSSGSSQQAPIKMTAKAMAARRKVLGPSTPDPTKAPPTYKRGVVPRYLRSQKKEQQKGDTEELFGSQEGYIPLPNETRKEVLTMLRKSFADLAHQLNMLPLRPPNLEIRERRIDIGKQLDKLEEAIHVFSQSDVSVKVALHKKIVKSI